MTAKNLFLLLTFFFFSCKKEMEIFDLGVIIPIDSISVSDPLVPSFSFPCLAGYAGDYPCKGYDLIGHLSLKNLETTMANDSWGWTDKETGKEYALVGVYEGTAFVDISKPDNPIYLGRLPSASFQSDWRDIKVYKDYAFIVSEAKEHGLQIFNLKNLRDLKSPIEYKSTNLFKSIGAAHNLFINENSGYAYILGSRKLNGLGKGGPIFINISDPENPIWEGGYEANEYVHDAQIVTYKGPDNDYFGREIYVGSHGSQSSENNVVILDVTEKKSPKLISSFTYPNSGYAHQGYFSEDHRYFFLGDELDEINYGGLTKTFIFDFKDLDNPNLSFINSGKYKAIDHNGYIKENLFYMANYTAGVRVYDITNVGNKIIEEIGFFDTYPKNNDTAFEGAWNVYPFFESKNIIISDINSGLFIIKSNKLLVN
tara:strand:- start:3129 stop:4409 length:1281 start_codon:yes stop_codon:yes gene_type:complete